MHKNLLKTGIIFGMLSVVLGAFAAHGLKKIVSVSSLSIFETAVRYQFYHSIALIINAMMFKDFDHLKLNWAARLFIVGIFLFSGSLYLLSILSQYPIIGVITPLGGISFILGWIMLYRAVNSNQ